MTGQVIKFYNSFFFVQVDITDQPTIDPSIQRSIDLIPCKLRGIIKRDKKSGSSVYPGDFVEISPLADGTGVIKNILPRKSLLNRPAVANVDRVILTFAAANPNLHPLLLNRFIVLAEQAQLAEIIICVNKIDLAAENFLSEYESLYKIIRTSTVTGEGIDALKNILSSGVTVFAGPSGVGKSSLLNAIDANLKLKVGKVSEKILRGKHTTRICELIKFRDGFLVDTPGFSAVDLKEVGITKNNLRYYFKEFAQFSAACKFLNDCSHDHEPNCGVRSAVAEGKILRERYENYLTILKEL
ncbi:MAG: ribosome small subunit-dependent GTPase A [Selenomonadaceae bacterium]|nr:ribosome small subunit-dependent GTPase A [Selenomonadaceae bacterium]